jgi:hypothetical protein
MIERPLAEVEGLRENTPKCGEFGYGSGVDISACARGQGNPETLL